jgi:hypothetical protein
MELGQVAEERANRWVLVNTIIKLQVPKNTDNFLTS